MADRQQGLATVAQLEQFDEIIDTRSPAEFAEDHIPGAINCPALDNEQRAAVGTLYKQVSPFAARRYGAALVARNIADHILGRFQERGREWRPLVYCWRGGQRSGAFVTVLRSVGWDACQLDGGYRAYRRHVAAGLAELPGRFSFRVVCGATGSGKSRILEALRDRGAQVLDLEALAAHKGSVLGDLPGAPQPGQKLFESRVHHCLARLDPARPVFVEAESKRIGSVHVPENLITAMRASPCLCIEAELAARVEFLLRDYDYFLQDPARLLAQIARLRDLRGGETIARWEAYVSRKEWRALVAELLAQHYDPLYHRSQGRNFPAYEGAPRFCTDDLSEEGIVRLAGEILASETAALAG